MCYQMIAQAGGSTVGNYSGIMQGYSTANTASNNATIAGEQRDDTLNRGAADQAVQRNKTAQLVGAARAGMGASGVQVDNGSFGDVLAQSAARGDRVEILSGLDDGERVVVGPPVGLREGRVLEVLP